MKSLTGSQVYLDIGQENNDMVFKYEDKTNLQKKPHIPQLALNEDTLGTPSFNRSLVKNAEGSQNTPKFSDRTRLLTQMNIPMCEVISETEELVDPNSQLRDSSSSFDLRITHVEIGGSPPNQTDKSSQEGGSTKLSLSKDPQRLESRSSLVTEDEEKEAELIKQRIRNLEQECQNFFKKRELAATIVTVTETASKEGEGNIVTSPRNRADSSCYSLRSASPNTSKFEPGRSVSMSPQIDNRYPGLAQFLKINRLQTESLARIAREESEKPQVYSLLSKYLSADSQRPDKFASSGWQSAPISNYSSNPQIPLVPPIAIQPSNRMLTHPRARTQAQSRLELISNASPKMNLHRTYLQELQNRHTPPTAEGPTTDPENQTDDRSRRALVRSGPEEKSVFVRRPLAWDTLRLSERTDSAGHQGCLTRQEVPSVRNRQAVCEMGPVLKGVGRNVIALRKPLGITIRRPIDRQQLPPQGSVELRQPLPN